MAVLLVIGLLLLFGIWVSLSLGVHAWKQGVLCLICWSSSVAVLGIIFIRWGAAIKQSKKQEIEFAGSMRRNDSR